MGIIGSRSSAAARPTRPASRSAYAGTAYSVQSRTSAAAVLYVAKPTDARETYVGLTRHRIDARVVAERDRLEAAVRQRQSDIRVAPSETAIRERLFTEARSYAEKANVADYVDDRIAFMRTGQIEIRRDAPIAQSRSSCASCTTDLRGHMGEIRRPILDRPGLAICRERAPYAATGFGTRG